jgi:hypothetical protein
MPSGGGWLRCDPIISRRRAPGPLNHRGREGSEGSDHRESSTLVRRRSRASQERLNHRGRDGTEGSDDRGSSTLVGRRFGTLTVVWSTTSTTNLSLAMSARRVYQLARARVPPCPPSLCGSTVRASDRRPARAGLSRTIGDPRLSPFLRGSTHIPPIQEAPPARFIPAPAPAKPFACLPCQRSDTERWTPADGVT